MPTIQNTMEWEPVAVPLAKGVDLNTRDRLIEANALAVAENVYYSKSGGPVKRRGHTAHNLYNAFMTYLSGLTAPNNLYGYGNFDVDNIPTGDCLYPQAGSIKDILVHDNREIAWDGWRFYEPLEAGISGKCRVTNAFLPSYTSESIAKSQRSQALSCTAQNATTRIVAYIDVNGAATAKLYDVPTDTLKFTVALNEGGNSPAFVRTVTCGEFVHALVADDVDEVVYCYSFQNNATELTRVTSVLACDPAIGSPFDVWKFDENKFLVGSIHGGIRLSWMNYNGSPNITTITQNAEFATTGTANNLAICVHPVTKNVAVFYANSTPAQKLVVYDEYGNVVSPVHSVGSLSGINHLAIAPSYVDEYYHLYADQPTTVYRYTYSIDDLVNTATRYNVHLASRACRVGNVPFVWLTNTSALDAPLQTTYFLVGNDLNPVGKVEYTTAVVNSEDKWLPGINFTVASDGTWATTKFHGSLTYTERVVFEDEGDGTKTTYSDYGIKFYQLNFTPDNLSYDQAGKCIYIAGAQLWSYDGDTLREANHTVGVDEIDVAPDNDTGDLTNDGVYRWRIDLCYKNAKNEESRAISFLTEEVTLGGADNTAVLTFKQPMTGITDGYYLIYRNQSAGTVWYLVNSRITAPVPYNAAAATITYIDVASDASILDNEQHPANADGYIQTIAAPACQYISFGKNRLWLAGGEISPGEVWPSRLFAPGQVPAYNWILAFQVDRTTEGITAFGFQSDYGVVFKKNSIYIITDEVSTNTIQPGVAPRVQKALADRGCINHKSVGALYNSVAFQSESGYKVIGASGQMEDIGIPVETARGTCIGALLVRTDEHLRFYQSDEQSLVFDYRDKLWTTFNFNTKPTAACLSNRTGLAVLARGSALLYETDDATRDGDFDFYYTIRTAQLAKQIGGFQRVRRVYCIGEKDGIPPPVTMRIYQDGHDYWSDQIVWDYSDDLNTSTIGQGTIGDNFIGDPTSAEFRDSIWKWRYRIESRKQKCENIAIELTDKGRLKTTRWIPVAFGLEIGTKNGLDRLAARTVNKE